MGGRRGNKEGSIFKRERDQRWVAILDMGRRNGKRVRREFIGHTRAEVVEKLHVAQQQVMNGLALLDPKLTVGQFLMWWQENILNPDDERKDRTKKDYRSILKWHLIPHLGKERLGSLNDKPIRLMLKKLQDQGLASRRRQYVHAVLRIALGDAEREGLVHRNIAKLITVKSSKKVEVNPYTPEEAAVLLKAAEPERLGAVIRTAITTGMRQSEILALQWDAVDIDSEYPKVHIRRSLVIKASILDNPDDWWSLETPKTERSNRVLWLPEKTRQALVEHRANQTEWERSSNFVFARGGGQPLSQAVVSKMLNRVIARAGLRHQRFHDMRHAAASYWAAMGFSLHEIMGFLGHSSISLTANLYTHLMPAASQEAASRMDRFLSESTQDTPTVKAEVIHG